MIHKLLAWLRSAYARVNGFLWSFYGGMAMAADDDEEIRRALLEYDRERDRRAWRADGKGTRR